MKKKNNVEEMPQDVKDAMDNVAKEFKPSVINLFGEYLEKNNPSNQMCKLAMITAMANELSRTAYITLKALADNDEMARRMFLKMALSVTY